MSLDNIYVGDYGQPIELTVLDVDTGAAADISGYTTSQKMIFTSPAGTVTEKAAAFSTDGTDGIIRYTVENGLLNAAGNWEVRGRVASGSAVLSTEKHRVNGAA